MSPGTGMNNQGLIGLLRRKPVPFVLGATLVPASVCTLLAVLWFPQWWQLVGFFWYSIPGNSFIYLPHEPAVIYAGSVYQPWLVAIVGGVATMVAAIVDYFVVRKVFALRRVAPVKETPLYQTAVRYFSWAPWLTVAFFAISPLPFYVVRVLAPSAGYPLWRYVSATVVGRIPRYYLLALGGAWVPVPPRYLMLMMVGLIAATIILSVYGARHAARSQHFHPARPEQVGADARGED